jgi:tRNA(Ile)-lysidine synthase
VVRADYDLLHEFSNVARESLLVSTYSDALIFDLPRWREQPLSIRRALVRWAAYQLRRSLRDVTFDHVEQAVDTAQYGPTGAQATLPRMLALTVGYTTLTVAHAGALHLPVERPWLEPGDEVEIAAPGVTALPNGWALHVIEHTDWDMNQIAVNLNPLVAWVDRESLDAPRLLRTRREGDRFRPQGMHGSEVRLSDYLINTKLPRPWRDHLPLLVSGDRLVWVVGVRTSQESSVRANTRHITELRAVGPRESPARCE